MNRPSPRRSASSSTRSSERPTHVRFPAATTTARASHDANGYRAGLRARRARRSSCSPLGRRSRARGTRRAPPAGHARGASPQRQRLAHGPAAGAHGNWISPISFAARPSGNIRRSSRIVVEPRISRATTSEAPAPEARRPGIVRRAGSSMTYVWPVREHVPVGVVHPHRVPRQLVARAWEDDDLRVRAVPLERGRERLLDRRGRSIPMSAAISRFSSSVTIVRCLRVITS